MRELAGELAAGTAVGRLGSTGVPVWAAGDYDGALKRLVRAYKDGERRDLRPVMATVVSRALQQVLGAESGCEPESPVWVVPAPSRASTRRSRGDDPLADLARTVVARLPGRLEVVPALRMVGVGQDQSRLDRAQRLRNLTDHVRLAPAVVRRAGRWAPASVVLMDDIVTTGATLRACQAALASGGLPVQAAVVAARVP